MKHAIQTAISALAGRCRTTPSAFLYEQPERPCAQLHGDLLAPRRGESVIFHAIAEHNELIGGNGDSERLAVFQDALGH